MECLQRTSLILQVLFIDFVQESGLATIFITVDQGHLTQPEELRYKSQKFDLSDKETLVPWMFLQPEDWIRAAFLGHEDWCVNRESQSAKGSQRMEQRREVEMRDRHGGVGGGGKKRE